MRARAAVWCVLLWAAAGWAQSTFHGNVARTGVYDGAGPKTLKGVKWTFKAGGPIVTSPAVGWTWHWVMEKPAS